jgi:uncharacterized protein YceH (UPF0502 family)
MDADAVEIRVLGCLIEKQHTTPEIYPLTLNALRLACNQSTNRDPVVSYDDETIREALQRLIQRRWARLASSPASRAVKYRHLLDEELGLSEPELALLAVLMLRGAQTPGELKGRTERLHRFESLADVHETLDGLIARELVVRHPRRPGQKEDRYEQLLGGDGAPAREAETDEAPIGGDVEARLSRLEEEVASLRKALETLGAAPLPAAGAHPMPAPAPANPAEGGGEEPPRQTWASGEL